jgi:hypothetical protein
MHLSFQHFLQQLVRYLATRPDLADIAVVRCTLMFASPARDEQMARLLGRYGFELVPGASALTLSEHARRFGENIQISLVVLTHIERRSDATRCAGAAPGCSCRATRSSSGTAVPPAFVPSRAPLPSPGGPVQNSLTLSRRERTEAALSPMLRTDCRHLQSGRRGGEVYAFPCRSNARRRRLCERGDD